MTTNMQADWARFEEGLKTYLGVHIISRRLIRSAFEAGWVYRDGSIRGGVNQ